MQGINDIALEINSKIYAALALSKCINVSLCNLYGITQPVTVAGVTYPAVLGKDGTYTGIKDSVPLIIYHKSNAVSFAELPKSGYGDKRSNSVSATFSMTMVIYANNPLVCMKSDEIFLALVSAIPESLDLTNFSQVNIKINSAILNPSQVFQNEYKGVDDFLNPETSLISISYTIESKFLRNCFNFCP